MQIDLSWWPVLVLPFPFTEGGLTLDFTWLDSVLSTAGRVVGPLLVFVMVFYAVRSLFVNFSGGGD